MKTIQDIEARREAIFGEMRLIRSMERGSITEQYLKVPQRGKKPALRGPYYLMSRKEGKRTAGYRLTTKEEVERARRDVAAYRRFTALCDEYERLTDQLGPLERFSGGADAKKKPRRSPSSKTPK